MRAHEVIQDGGFFFKLLYFFVKKQSLTASLTNTRDIKDKVFWHFTQKVLHFLQDLSKFLISFLLNRETKLLVLIPPLMP